MNETLVISNLLVKLINAHYKGLFSGEMVRDLLIYFFKNLIEIYQMGKKNLIQNSKICKQFC